MKELKKKIIILIILIFLIHLPRLYIEIKSRISNNKLHGEDTYQKTRNSGNDMNRIITWSSFEMNDADWKEYVKNLHDNLINLYRKELGDLIKDISDEDLVSFQTIDDEMLCIPDGEVASTRIDNKRKLFKSSFNHEWCSGHFFFKIWCCYL